MSRKERTTLAAIRELNAAYIMDRQGRDFILYAGLLDAATRAGIASIDTRLIQAPNDTNGHTAIVHARVTMSDGEGLQTFDGIGDANPANTSRAIAPHAIRMAETRAKARALRDALNLGGIAAWEEVDDGDRDPGGPPGGPAARRPIPPPTRAAPASAGQGAPGGAPQASPTATRPALSVVLPPEHLELLNALRRGLVALNRPVDEEAIGKMSLTLLRVQVKALAEEWFALHPEQDKRPKPPPEPPVRVEGAAAAAVARNAAAYRQAGSRITDGTVDDAPDPTDDFADVRF